jgi:TrwC relaxase
MHMAGDDYLTEHGQAEMIWCGRDAVRLGLHGVVHKDDFRKLCEGKHPVTGETLSVRDSGPVRRVCYFGQVAPPKDVSIAYLVGGDERIAGWWKEAVNDTVKEIEAITATRVRKGSIDDDDRFTGANRANLKEHKLFNGNIVEVAGVREDGAIVLKDKRTIPPQFRQFSHGYATTSHAAQGKTINRGIVLMAGEGMKAANLRQAYVSHSRFEESHVTYTTNRRAAMNAMATPAERALATRGSHALVSAATFLKTFQLERELEASFHALGEIVFRTGLDPIGGEYGRVLVDVNVGANTDKRRFPRVFRGGNGERPDTSAVEL